MIRLFEAFFGLKLLEDSTLLHFVLMFVAMILHWVSESIDFLRDGDPNIIFSNMSQNDKKSKNSNQPNKLDNNERRDAAAVVRSEDRAISQQVNVSNSPTDKQDIQRGIGGGGRVGGGDLRG